MDKVNKSLTIQEILGQLEPIAICTVKPALVITCIKRPPLFKDFFFLPKRGHLIQVSLYCVTYNS